MKTLYIILAFIIVTAVCYLLCCYVNPFLGIAAIPVAIKILDMIYMYNDDKGLK